MPKASNSFPDAFCKPFKCHEESKDKPRPLSGRLSGGFLLFRTTFLRIYSSEDHKKIPPKGFASVKCIIYMETHHRNSAIAKYCRLSKILVTCISCSLRLDYLFSGMIQKPFSNRLYKRESRSTRIIDNCIFAYNILNMMFYRKCSMSSVWVSNQYYR